MHADPLSIALSWHWLAVLVMALSNAAAIWLAPWAALRRVPQRLHMMAGGALACLCLWWVNVAVDDGPLLHFLGTASLALMLGWDFALLLGAVNVIVFHQLMGLPWAGIPVAWLLNIGVPVGIVQLGLYLTRTARLRQPFVYMLGVGFLGSALGVFAAALVALGISGLPESTLSYVQEYWPLVFLMMFSEGFINGMCVSALAVYYPHWMRTLDDYQHDIASG
jgi:uncharacterized membrane protein